MTVTLFIAVTRALPSGPAYPLTVTGIAPWAAPLKPTTLATGDKGRTPIEAGYRGRDAPITHSLATTPPHFNVSTFMPPRGRPPPLPLSAAVRGAGRSQGQAFDPVSCLAAQMALPPLREGSERGGGGGYQRLLDFMELCLPSQKVAGDGTTEDDWRAAQTAATPTLLPTLRFHDLVFGGELGKGSFGTVKYSRKICRGRPRSEWPEYAVKIVSAETMNREGYRGSVVREMAVLQMVAHPGFSRLVSSFRYTHSAYLVLEYAGGGDLHSLVILDSHRGPVPAPLSHLCTRFILGEIVAALLSLHAIGLSYNDLKPENILVTESGHVKVADFGACRAFTECARDALEGAMKALSGGSALRNGDWRDEAAVGAGALAEDFAESSGDLDLSAVEVDDRSDALPFCTLLHCAAQLLYCIPTVLCCAVLSFAVLYSLYSYCELLGVCLRFIVGMPSSDLSDHAVLRCSILSCPIRLEGTPAYMPPELLRGRGDGSGQGAGHSDAWALGCVASFCLRGRPLYLGSAKEVRHSPPLSPALAVRSCRRYQHQHHCLHRCHLKLSMAPTLLTRLWRQLSLSARYHSDLSVSLSHQQSGCGCRDTALCLFISRLYCA